MADKYIEIKGPFHLRDHKAVQRIGDEILRIAKKHPQSQLILRDTKKTYGSSTYSASFEKLSAHKLAHKVKEVKANYQKHLRHLGPPDKVREAKIKALKPYKTIEFTFSGKVVGEDYASWRGIDKALGEEYAWDPLRSDPAPTGSKIRHYVKKYPGGTASATKKMDALIDKISAYGKTKNYRPEFIEAGIDFIRDKADLFYEQQRVKAKRKDPSPIHMMSEDRDKRLIKLQKDYGVPKTIKAPVNLAPPKKDTRPKKFDVRPERRGQVGSGYREGGDRTPTGYSLGEDTARNIDELSTLEGPKHLLKHEKEVMEAPQKPLENVETIQHKARQGTKKTIWNINQPRKTSLFPSVNPRASTGRLKGLPSDAFSNIVSGLAQFDPVELNPELAKRKQPITDEIIGADFESIELGEDRAGGTGSSVDTEEHLTTQRKKDVKDLEYIETKPWKNDPKGNIGDTKKTTRKSMITDSLAGDAVSPDLDPRSGGTQKAYSSTSPHSTGEPLTPTYQVDPKEDPYSGRPKKKEDKIHKAKLRAEELKGDTTKVITKYDQKGRPYPKLVSKYPENVSIKEMETIESGIRKQRGGLSRKEIAMRKFAERADATIKKASSEGKLIHVRTVPGDDQQIASKDKRQKIYTANVTKKSLIRQTQVEGQDLTKQVESLDTNIKKSLKSGKPAVLEDGKPIEIANKGFKGKKSGAMKVSRILGPLSVGLTAYFAKEQLHAKGIKKPTTKQYLHEGTSILFGSGRVFSGVGEKPGYIQNLTKYDITKLRESGKRRVPDKHVTGTVTPYDKIKESISGAMIEWSKASTKANEAMKLHGGWRFK